MNEYILSLINRINDKTEGFNAQGTVGRFTSFNAIREARQLSDTSLMPELKALITQSLEHDDKIAVYIILGGITKVKRIIFTN